MYRAAVLQVQQHMYHHPRLTLAGLQHLLLECQVSRTQPCRCQQTVCHHSASLHIGLDFAYNSQYIVDHDLLHLIKPCQCLWHAQHFTASTVHATVNTFVTITVQTPSVKSLLACLCVAYAANSALANSPAAQRVLQPAVRVRDKAAYNLVLMVCLHAQYWYPVMQYAETHSAQCELEKQISKALCCQCR